MHRFLFLFLFISFSVFADENEEKSFIRGKYHIAKDGSITYQYGSGVPLGVGSPNFPVSISLESQEIIRDIHVGDIDNWSISVASVGAKDFSQSVVIAKPLTVGVSTSLLISTDVRFYDILLVSEAINWSPSISFRYSDNINFGVGVNLYSEEDTNVDKEENTEVDKETNESVLTIPNILESLNFGYKKAGNFDWTPVRIFDDGAKTYIEMPRAIDTIEAPVLLLMDLGKDVVVNYRVIKEGKFPKSKTFYVIDKLIKKAKLIRGVGIHQQKVEIWKE